MKKLSIISIAIFVTILTSQLVAYAVPWLGSITRNNDIQITNVNRYEPSGLAWNSLNDRLFAVSDDGRVTRMNLDGTGQETVNFSYRDPNNGGTYRDFEAITIADPSSDKLYIGVEHRDSIVEIEWPEGGNISVTRAWDLTNVLIGSNNSGLEGLTFVPNAYLPENVSPSDSGGLFYAAVQRAVNLGDVATNNDYLIYAFDLDLSANGTTIVDPDVAHGITYAAGTPTSDISDMFFSKDTGVLSVLYDGANRLIEMNTEGVVLNDYSNVPVLDQE
ncbi:MAG: SdiA-regulated domain-containing protein, partial [Chlamydiota bacterium]|nr:SdiA-regulated domain-containing protein [Chlamydiota bacterium]